MGPRTLAQQLDDTALRRMRASAACLAQADMGSMTEIRLVKPGRP
jgi:hypothetical protein